MYLFIKVCFVSFCLTPRIENLLKKVEATLQDSVLCCTGWKYGCQKYSALKNICLGYKFRIYYNRKTSRISTTQRQYNWKRYFGCFSCMCIKNATWFKKPCVIYNRWCSWNGRLKEWILFLSEKYVKEIGNKHDILRSHCIIYQVYAQNRLDLQVVAKAVKFIFSYAWNYQHLQFILAEINSQWSSLLIFIF